jgi:hypothetical protein
MRPPLCADRRLLRLDPRDALAQARVRHARRSPECIERLLEARRATRVKAFAVPTPPNPEYHEAVIRSFLRTVPS